MSQVLHFRAALQRCPDRLAAARGGSAELRLPVQNGRCKPEKARSAASPVRMLPPGKLDRRNTPGMTLLTRVDIGLCNFTCDSDRVLWLICLSRPRAEESA
jgi:hypothetical protein